MKSMDLMLEGSIPVGQPMCDLMLFVIGILVAYGIHHPSLHEIKVVFFVAHMM